MRGCLLICRSGRRPARRILVPTPTRSEQRSFRHALAAVSSTSWARSPRPDPGGQRRSQRIRGAIDGLAPRGGALSGLYGSRPMVLDAAMVRHSRRETQTHRRWGGRSRCLLGSLPQTIPWSRRAPKTGATRRSGGACSITKRIALATKKATVQTRSSRRSCAAEIQSRASLRVAPTSPVYL
jgi:hypothetical protein